MDRQAPPIPNFDTVRQVTFLNTSSSYGYMKTQYYSVLKVAVFATALTCGAVAQAITSPAVPSVNNSVAGPSMLAGPIMLQSVAFRDSAEADMLRRAYRILATGDHDYNGHRVRAMHAVEAAGKLLGMDLAGDLKDRTPQKLSDERLREAQGLITQVLGSAEVKDQKRVVRHLNEAVKQINTALSVH